MKKALFTAMAVAVLAILPATAQAVPIAGDLSLSGSVRVTGTAIEWVTASSGFDFIVIDDTNSDFFDYLAFSFGDATDLDSAAQPAGLPFPGGPLLNFLTFVADPGLTFTLETIEACDLASCFFPGTPFNYLQTFNATTGKFDTTIQMAMTGLVSDTTPNEPGDTTDPSFWEGSWTATFQGQSVDDLRTQFLRDGQITDEYDAELNVTLIPTQIPEPATLLTFGAGTALLAARRRRRAKNS